MIKRILSAVILIPIVVWLVMFANKLYFALAIIIVGLAAYIEWLNMVNGRFNFVKSIYFLCAAFFLFVFVFYNTFALTALLFIFIVHMVISFYFLDKDSLLEKYYFLSGILYVCLYLFLYMIIKEEKGRALLMVLFVSIWAGDSFAYFCGRWFGKHKMAKSISPKKTIEGGVCGVILGAASGAFFAFVLNLPELKMFFIALIANIAGIIGDLSESVIKRVFNKKDSSNIIPGHGGILDRLDSIAFAGFVVYILTSWKIL